MAKSMGALSGAHMPPEDRVRLVTDNASSVTINPQVKASQYFRTGKEMLRTAANYQEDGCIENAYLLYTRFLMIFVDKLRTHPGFKDIPASDRKQMHTYCREVLPKAETLKKELLASFTIEHEEYLQREEERLKRLEEEALKRKQEEERMRLLNEEVAKLRLNSVPVPSLSTTTQPKLPQSKHPPEVNPVPSYATAVEYLTPDQKYGHVVNNGPSSSYSSLDTTHPAFDRSVKPTRLLTPNASGLRQVVISKDVTTKFLQLADSNTKLNKETCGILAGKIIQGKLIVTYLIIPKQKGTSDSCATENEEELFQIQDNLNLITLGWIHTHPSQTAFLSSVDLHTHWAYQIMLPEAIAIVCAPSYNETGIFTLTPSGGMEVIANCTEEGFHPHPSTSVPLFAEAKHVSVDEFRNVTVTDLRRS